MAHKAIHVYYLALSRKSLLSPKLYDLGFQGQNITHLLIGECPTLGLHIDRLATIHVCKYLASQKTLLTFWYTMIYRPLFRLRLNCCLYSHLFTSKSLH